MNENYLVAVGDIAGFKKKVIGTKDFTELIALVDDFIDYLNHSTCYLNVTHTEVLPKRKETKFRFSHSIFSDTILIWCKISQQNLTKKRGEIFFQSIGSIIAASIMHNLPLRLGIAYGECYIHKKFNIYIGKPIIDAYLLSEAQDWLGGAIHKSCICLPNTNSIIDFDVPIKNDCLGKVDIIGKTIDWTRFIIRKEDNDAIKKAIQTNIEITSDKKIIDRWKRTEEFYYRFKNRRPTNHPWFS